MSDTDGYNGWTNRETWLVSLWLNNDEGTYTEIREIVAQRKEDATEPTLVDALAYAAAGDIEHYVDELPEVAAITEGPASFVVDILGTALARVNWEEIAASILAE